MSNLPALSNMPLRPSTTPPLWRTVWATSLSAPTWNNTRVIKKTFATPDSVTGFNYTTDLQAIFGISIDFGVFGRQGGSSYESAYVNDATLTARYNTDFTDSIAASSYAGYTGAQELLLGLNTRYNNGAAVEDNPQLNLYLGCISIAQGTSPPVNELYIRIVFKLPAALDLQDASGATYGKFYAIYELKTGGEGGSPAQGDWRLKVIVDGATGTNRYLVACDNVANLSTNPALVEYFTYTDTGEVSLGTYNTMHLKFKRPASVDDITTGVLQLSIDQPGYGRTVLADIGAGVGRILEPTKSPLMGDFNYPFTRFFGNCYTRQETADLPSIPIIYSEYGFWREPPFAIV